MKPSRKCIACGSICDKDLLQRFVFKDGELIADEKQNMPGRGCYICKTKECAELAVKKHAFSRAFKTDISKEALGRCFNDR